MRPYGFINEPGGSYRFDVLIPAALENAITEQNAAQIKAPLVVEVANGPISHEADEILNKNKKEVIPDILANAGGVTVSYFEWVQNKSGFYWTVEEVHEKLQPIMAREYAAVADLSEQHSISPRLAAYVHSLNRMGKAVESQGTREYFTAPR